VVSKGSYRVIGYSVREGGREGEREGERERGECKFFGESINLERHHSRYRVVVNKLSIPMYV
jgi:hypothetical protein